MEHLRCLPAVCLVALTLVAAPVAAQEDAAVPPAGGAPGPAGDEGETAGAQESAEGSADEAMEPDDAAARPPTSARAEQGEGAGSPARGRGAGATEGAAPRVVRASTRGTEWVADVYDSARGALVTIRCGWRRGTGFLFESPDQVATTDRWAGCTRGIEVDLPDGQTVEVERGRVDYEAGVALLRLPVRASAEPLRAAEAPLRVGDPVAVLGKDPHGDNPPVVAVGMVTAEPGETVRTDVDPPEGSTGGPVLGADGSVVGVMGRGRHHGPAGRVEPVAHLDTLTAEGSEEDLGRTVTVGLGLFGALTLDEDPAVEGRDVWLGGFGGALSLTVLDRLTFVGGFSVLRDATDLFAEDGTIKRSAHRYQAELRGGWRILLSSHFPVYLIPSLGASARWDTWTDRHLRIQLADPACDLSAGSACELSTDVVEEETDDFSITPYVHLAMRMGPLELGYSLSLAVDAPGTLVHRFLLTGWLGR